MNDYDYMDDEIAHLNEIIDDLEWRITDLESMYDAAVEEIQALHKEIEQLEKLND